MKFVIALSALNLAVSCTLLTVAIVGGRRLMAEMKIMKSKAHASIKGLKDVLDEMEI